MITHLHSPSNSSVPSSPLTQKFCVAMVRQLEPAFCQCCCQVPDVRHRGWGPTAFREALADGPGRCSWAPVLVGLGKMVSPCPVHWTSGYWEKITPYCICFFLAKKKKNSGFCLSSLFVQWRNVIFIPCILCVINKTSLLFSRCGITPQIFSIPGYARVPWNSKL